MRSILGPLTLGLLLSLALVFLVQWTVARGAVESMLEDHVAAELRQDAEELSNWLVVQADDSSFLSIGHFDPVFLQAASGRYFAIAGGDGAMLRSPSLGDFRLDAAAIAPTATVVTRATGPAGQQLLVSTTGFTRHQRQFTISVAADMQPVRQRIDRFLLRYTLLTLVLFATLVALQVWIVRRALAPLRETRADVARLERGEISQLGEAVPSEVLPLVRSINRLLALLVDRLRRSREALGNLSHALKTPLTLLTQLSEHDAIRADAALRTQMLEQLRIVGDSIDRELRRARVAGHSSQAQAVDLATTIDGVLLTMRKLHRDRELDIAATITPGARFHGDREDLLELAGNLLDNACKWARRRVSLRIDTSDGLRLTVEDDGPGCPDADLARLAERGVRLDETTAGHGLGLAIVRNVVSSYGGELAFGRSPELGGFRVVVVLPAGGGLGCPAASPDASGG